MVHIRKLSLKGIVKLLGFTVMLMIACVGFSDEMIAARAFQGSVFTCSSTSRTELYNAVISERNLDTDGPKAIEASGSNDESLAGKALPLRLPAFPWLNSVKVYDNARENLIPCGDAIGITIHTDGVLIVGFGEITANGRTLFPAKRSGLKVGDIIKKVNGYDVCTANELQLALDASSGDAVITAERGGKAFTVYVQPEPDESGRQRIGAWVRDSTIGIGTLSFVIEKNESTAALGHAVLDSDTSAMLPVLSGSMVSADILGVKKGERGIPGELKGAFSSKSRMIGSIERNYTFGISGRLSESAEVALLYSSRAKLPIAFPDEVHTGDARIISQINSCSPEEYSCRIIRTVNQSKPEQKGLVVEITDERLLSSTGGIVQGMSGSPIIQDGRLAGVITHVFINDPTKGYGIYAFWMCEPLCEQQEG